MPSDNTRPIPSAPRSADPDALRRLAARMSVADWLGAERREYADTKYGGDTEAIHRLELEMRNYGYAGEWEVFITNYIGRAKLFGLDTLQGRQAMGKAVVTMLRCLEMAVEVHGPMPAPGVSSTDGAREWVR